MFVQILWMSQKRFFEKKGPKSGGEWWEWRGSAGILFPFNLGYVLWSKWKWETLLFSLPFYVHVLSWMQRSRVHLSAFGETEKDLCKRSGPGSLAGWVDISWKPEKVDWARGKAVQAPGSQAPRRGRKKKKVICLHRDSDSGVNSWLSLLHYGLGRLDSLWSSVLRKLAISLPLLPLPAFLRFFLLLPLTACRCRLQFLTLRRVSSG